MRAAGGGHAHARIQLVDLRSCAITRLAPTVLLRGLALRRSWLQLVRPRRTIRKRRPQSRAVRGGEEFRGDKQQRNSRAHLGVLSSAEGWGRRRRAPSGTARLIHLGAGRTTRDSTIRAMAAPATRPFRGFTESSSDQPPALAWRGCVHGVLAGLQMARLRWTGRRRRRRPLATLPPESLGARYAVGGPTNPVRSVTADSHRFHTEPHQTPPMARQRY